MAISLSKRRIVACNLEAVGGTPGVIDRGIFRAPNVAADAIPTIREAKITRFEPVKVERETLRLSLTGMPDIYPGVAIAELTFVAEIGGVPPNTSAPATSAASPVWTDLFRACGYVEVSNQGSPISAVTAAALASTPRIFTFANQTGGAGSAWRHGEAASVAYTVGGPLTGVFIGDTFADDDLVCIQETGGTVGTAPITAITGGTSGRASSGAAPVRDTTVVVALKLQSDINFMETISLEAYLDGKRIRLKGCMGNFEIRMVHGDVLHAEFKFTGIVESYGDAAMPTNANESHYLPPTFLGKDIRFREIDGSKTYGKDTGSALQVGSLNNVKYSSGNSVIMRENSLSASGYSFAYITDRKPGGSFNPDEVAEAEFSFINAFVNGRAIRGKALFGSTTSGDGNSIDIITPGLVFSGMADGDRDGINIFDASFDLTGGDYDSSATTEIPGTDNEITLIYR